MGASDAARLTCFWAKSDAGGRPHSLIAHLLDAAAVAELIWDSYLAPKVRRQFDDAAGGRGRALLALLAGWHDLGKATPAFQFQPGHPPEADAGLRQAGLLPSPSSQRWPHQSASAIIADEVLKDTEVAGREWLSPLLAGHHGKFGHPGRPPLLAHGNGTWRAAQRELAAEIAERLGVGLGELKLRPPSRSVQLAMAGFIVMSDWIASSNLFPGVGLSDLTMDAARERAAGAWPQLGLDSGWDPGRLLTNPDDVGGRFGFEPRPLQRLVAEAAAAEETPGLLVVEAPMGEGKTEAALAAAEILASRTGCGGVLFAMPTQGTTDAMYVRVKDWLGRVDPSVVVTLLHGKAMLNETWREELSNISIGGVFGDRVDEYGLPDSDDPFGLDTPATRHAPMSASWVCGRHRGLLADVVVCTVDQVLWAATRTKFVSLRHAGLSGRVLIIDEVHSYDAYMSVFLHELLRWCARLSVPVVLMSATLPPDVRAGLIAAYRQGAGHTHEATPTVAGYPSVVAIHQDGSQAVTTCAPHRADIDVRVRVLPTDDPEDVAPIAEALAAEVADGGCALAIMNTVRRAQEVYLRLKGMGLPVLLIHGRLTAAKRARRTEAALNALGVKGPRPHQLVVVATQIAEQSFDADADVLYSDVAPIDLMLQRVGRLHRHTRASSARPPALRVPRLVVTGLAWQDGEPAWPRALASAPHSPAPKPGNQPRTVYRPYPLMATAAALRAPTVWAIPSQVPTLVADAYGDAWVGPAEWLVATDSARTHEAAERQLREHRAATYRLDADPGTSATTLWGLHAQASAESDDGGREVVRDGDDTLEVSLIRRSADGFSTLGGLPLGANAERVSSDDVAREILGDSVRLRWRPELAAVGHLPQWHGHALLGFMPVLVLDEAGRYQIGKWTVTYDPDIGLAEA